MRLALVVPIDPDFRGNGLAHRAKFWRDTLATLGDLTTVVVPVSGPPPLSAPSTGRQFSTIVVDPEHMDHAWLPTRALRAPEYLGARLAAAVQPFDLVVAFRSYMGPFAIGLGRANESPLIVDLDDDDETFYSEIDDQEESQRFRQLVAMIDRRAARLTSADGFNSTVHVPNALSPLPGQPTKRCGDPRIVFVGNFAYAPNSDGATWFNEQVVPLIIAEHPDVEIVIAGPGSETLENGVGFVDDLHDLYAAAAVAVAPVLTGSGSRIKVIEAWQHGVPVVSTTVGVDGLHVDSGGPALVADSAKYFAAHVCALLDDRDLATTVALAGREQFDSNHDSGVVRASVVELCQDVIAGRPRRSTPSPIRELDPVEVDDGLVVYESSLDTAHHLNPTAAIVFTLIDGTLSSYEIAESVRQIFDLDETPYQVVSNTIEDLRSKRLVRN